MSEPDPARARGRLLVVSHPAVVSVNQEVYRELARRGWQLTLVLPSRWRHDYSKRDFAPQALAGLQPALQPVPVILRGRPQRHLYLTSARRLVARVRPSVAFLEAEPFALPAAQWAFALGRLGIPFGVQCYENIDRSLALPLRMLRTRVLRRAAFVAARSETAAAVVRSWGARGEVALAPPPVPAWPDAGGCAPGAPAAGEDAAPAHRQAPSAQGAAPAHRPFTIGYAGRLTESKGLLDLLGAVRLLRAPVQLVLIGDGELRAQLEGQPIPGSAVAVRSGLRHDQMATAYAQLDVLVLPSRTTRTWKEQFGRVLIEALSCGVPVVGSDSGEIPWLIGLTRGGLLFPEGDQRALAERLAALRDDPALRRELAARGKQSVERLFTVAASADALERLLLGAIERAADGRWLAGGDADRPPEGQPARGAPRRA